MKKNIITYCVLWLALANAAIPTEPLIRYCCHCTFKYQPTAAQYKSVAQPCCLMQDINGCIIPEGGQYFQEKHVAMHGKYPFPNYWIK